MRWLKCSYVDLQMLPEGYRAVAFDVAKEEARAARDRARNRGR